MKPEELGFTKKQADIGSLMFEIYELLGEFQDDDAIALHFRKLSIDRSQDPKGFILDAIKFLFDDRKLILGDLNKTSEIKYRVIPYYSAYLARTQALKQMKKSSRRKRQD